MATIKLLLILLLAIPFVYSAPYGTNTYNCGLYNIGCEQATEETQSGLIEAETAKPTAMTEILCNESSNVWYNEICYECDGFIFEQDGEILCGICPNGFLLLDGKCEATIEKKIPITSIVVWISLSLIAITILARKSRKQQKKLLTKLQKKFKKEGEEIERNTP